MIRHPQNTNLNLYFEDSYQGFPVQTMHGPLIVEYLDLLYLTVQRAVNEHPRVFAFRVDLRLPQNMDSDPYLGSNRMIERFIESFKAKIRHNRTQAKHKYGRAHDTAVRYVWAREVGRCGRPHFHLVIFLNNDAFGSLGVFEPGRENMFNRLQQAWASALGLSVDSVTGLVEIPSNPCYYLRRDDLKGAAELFYRASYLCKADTKSYGNGCHGFGCSRLLTIAQN
jgi:hypothetical protein